jgi:hypothetical protein
MVEMGEILVISALIGEMALSLNDDLLKLILKVDETAFSPLFLL